LRQLAPLFGVSKDVNFYGTPRVTQVFLPLVRKADAGRVSVCPGFDATTASVTAN
jgi:hypothetical protein